MEKPTAEKNGVEVTIKNISDLEPFNKALQYIVFFPNIYIYGADNADFINKAKLKRFKNFAAVSMLKPVPSKLLLGNVLYKCDKYHLSFNAQQFLNAIENTGIVIKFDVGEINITPNRENIIYSADTIRKIENRIMAAKRELEAMIGAKYTKDYDNIEEYFKAISGTWLYDPVIDKVSHSGYRFSPNQMETCMVTYRGKDLNKDIKGMQNLFNMVVPNYKGTIDGDKIVAKKLPWRLLENNLIRGEKILILNNNARLLASLKLYLKENYDEYSIMTDLTQYEFEEWVKDELSSIECPSSDNFYTIVDGVYESLKAKAKTLDTNNDKDFLAYKEELSSDKLSGIVKEREAILYVWNNRGYKEKKVFKRLSQAVMFIKNLRKGVILTGMDGDDILMSNLALLKGYVFIKARKDIVADLKKLNLSCIVDLNWLINEDPMLTVVNTLAIQFPLGMNACDINDVCYNLEESEGEEYKRLHQIYKKFKDNCSYYSLVKRKDFGIDHYTEYLCLKLKNYIEKHKEAKDLIFGSGCETNSTMVSAVIMRTKAYRISHKAYNRVKNNKLIRILCRKF